MAALLALIFIGITSFFWFYDWKYSLPTPVPEGYKTVSCGTPINVLRQLQSGNRPLFLHFFNPSCPCSRFNMPHFQSLVKQYGAKADFAIVVMSDKPHTVREIRGQIRAGYSCVVRQCHRP
ncbi:deiodinase-like protein [Puia sp. P3]|uniref:deiodinase-like protein n=1 Tax=Puia sp. P3 TaxID=3423952 RepID=UPI003D66D87F